MGFSRIFYVYLDNPSMVKVLKLWGKTQFLRVLGKSMLCLCLCARITHPDARYLFNPWDKPRKVLGLIVMDNTSGYQEVFLMQTKIGMENPWKSTMIDHFHMGKQWIAIAMFTNQLLPPHHAQDNKHCHWCALQKLGVRGGRFFCVAV